MSLIIDEHREYLQDAARLDAFRAAIAQRVRPGDVIVDLGAGTGVLGLLACQAGAARVYAIESSGMIDVARRIARASGFDARIVHLHGMSSLVAVPEPVDGLVCDQIGHFGFEAGLPGLAVDARRFLKAGAWTIPQSIEMRIAPVEQSEIRGRIDFWARPLLGLDFSPAQSWAANTGYPVRLEPAQLLGPTDCGHRMDLSIAGIDSIVIDTVLRIERAGTFDGVGGWFAASLAPGVTMTNAPGAPDRINRRNVVLPVCPGVPVRAGDTVAVSIRIMPADLLVSWRGAVTTKGGSIPFFRSTLSGMLLTRDDVRRLAPDPAPHLTERGRARRSVLELCDGVRPLREIERDMYAQYPGLFRSADEAAVFVAEVVSRYAE